MQTIQSIGNVNFNGGFLVNYSRAAKGTREQVEKFVGAKHKYVIDNFNGEFKRVLYVVTSQRDLNIANQLKINEVPTTYYPEFSTKQDLNTRAKAEKAISEYTDKIIRGAKRAFDYITETTGKKLPEQKMKCDIHDIVLMRLKLFFEPSVAKRHKRGIYTYKNVTGEKGEVTMSPIDSAGNIFIRIIEHDPNAAIQYYKFNKKTNTIVEYTDTNGILRYKKGFRNAVKNRKS